jgi:dTDP-4-dehydrorhamnose 3,5-epimerase
MTIKSTKISGFYEINNIVHEDERGLFQQWFTKDMHEDFIGKFEPVQANTSTSKKGVIRGIHYSTVGDGQAKMVICVAGKVRDAVVDIRKDSPTFGQYDVVELEAGSGKVAFIDVGLGHAFEVLSEEATIVYLLSSKYSQFFEKEINPLDKDININWLTKDPILSKKDKKAESFQEYKSKNKN